MVPLPPSYTNNVWCIVYVYISYFLLVHHSQINLNFNKYKRQIQYKRQIGDGQDVMLWV